MKNQVYFYLTLLLGLGGVLPGVQAASIEKNIQQVSQLYDRMLSTYKQSDYEIFLAQPGIHQKENILAIEGVEEIFPFFKDESSLQSNNLTVVSTVIFSNESNRDITPFNESRILEKLDSVPANFIEIDKIVADKLGLSLGDSVQLAFSFGASFPFTVSTIYMEDYSYSIDNEYNGVSYVEFTDALQDYLFTLYGEDFNYYGAFAKVADVNSTKTRLENEYKPYGQMLPRSNFPNQSAYDAYVETFLSKTYPFASTLKENALNVLISRLNFDIEHFREVQSNRQHNTFLLYSSIFTFLFFLISYLLYVYFKQLSFPIFKRLNIAFLFLAFFLLSSVLGILLKQGSFDLFLSVLPWMWTTILPVLFYLSIFAFSYFQTLPSQKVNPVHSKTHKKKDENFTSHDSLKGPNTPHEE